MAAQMGCTNGVLSGTLVVCPPLTITITIAMNHDESLGAEIVCFDIVERSLVFIDLHVVSHHPVGRGG